MSVTTMMLVRVLSISVTNITMSPSPPFFASVTIFKMSSFSSPLFRLESFSTLNIQERETLANNQEDMKYMLDEEKKRLKEQLDELRFDIDAKQYEIEQLTEEMNK